MAGKASRLVSSATPRSNQVAQRPLAQVDRAVTDHAPFGFIKIIYLPHGKILGATIVAPRAGEMITELALAKQHDLSLYDLPQTIHAYPTYSMGIQRLTADHAADHFLDSTAGKLLRKWFV